MSFNLGGLTADLQGALKRVVSQLDCIVQELRQLKQQGYQSSPTRFPFVSSSNLSAGEIVTIDARSQFGGPLQSGHIANIGNYQIDVTLAHPGPPERITRPYPLLPGTTLELPGSNGYGQENYAGPTTR